MDFKRYRNIPFFIASVSASMTGVYRILVTGILIVCLVVEVHRKYKNADDKGL